MLCQKAIMRGTWSTQNSVYWNSLSVLLGNATGHSKKQRVFKIRLFLHHHFLFFWCFFFPVVFSSKYKIQLFWFHFWFVFDYSLLLCYVCSEFKRHLLHFSCIPHCQSLLPPVMCLLKYCWHEYARKVNAKQAPQIIADPFKVPKPLVRSVMQRLLRETDRDLTCKQQEQASAITL